jgi:hypothetical protein
MAWLIPPVFLTFVAYFMPYLDLMYLLIILVVAGWVLRQKGRSLWHLLWFILGLYGASFYSASSYRDIPAMMGVFAGSLALGVIIILCLKNKKMVKYEKILE